MRPASDTTNPPFASLSSEWLERHLPMLAELAEMGMTLARRIMEQAEMPAEDGAPADPGLAAHRLARVGRMVGQTVALGAKLTEARRVRDEEANAGMQEQAASVRAARTQRQKDRVTELLPKARDQHHVEFSEETRCDLAWLSDLELRIDLDQYDPLTGGASVADTVERISRGLGVAFDAALWQEPGPESGVAELHPAVATTLAHRLRTARWAAQDRHLALLDAAIENRAVGDHGEAERLLTEAEERRGSKDYDPLVGDNAVAEIVEQVSRTLGVPFDASVWREQVPQVEIGGEVRSLIWPSAAPDPEGAAQAAEERWISERRSGLIAPEKTRAIYNGEIIDEAEALQRARQWYRDRD